MQNQQLVSEMIASCFDCATWCTLTEREQEGERKINHWLKCTLNFFSSRFQTHIHEGSDEKIHLIRAKSNGANTRLREEGWDGWHPPKCGLGGGGKAAMAPTPCPRNTFNKHERPTILTLTIHTILLIYLYTSSSCWAI